MEVTTGIGVGKVWKAVVGSGMMLGVNMLAPMVSSDNDIGVNTDTDDAEVWMVVKVDRSDDNTGVAMGRAVGVAVKVSRVLSSVLSEKKGVILAESAVCVSSVGVVAKKPSSVDKISNEENGEGTKEDENDAGREKESVSMVGVDMGVASTKDDITETVTDDSRSANVEVGSSSNKNADVDSGGTDVDSGGTNVEVGSNKNVDSRGTMSKVEVGSNRDIVDAGARVGSSKNTDELVNCDMDGSKMLVATNEDSEGSKSEEERESGPSTELGGVDEDSPTTVVVTVRTGVKLGGMDEDSSTITDGMAEESPTAVVVAVRTSADENTSITEGMEKEGRGDIEGMGVASTISIIVVSMSATTNVVAMMTSSVSMATTSMSSSSGSAVGDCEGWGSSWSILEGS